MAQPQIAVVGSINTDISVRSDRLPAAGETVLGGDWIMAGGGKGANQAVAAARAGARVRFVGRVGTDLFSCGSVERLKAEGIDTAHVVEDTAHKSGLAIIMVGPDGNNIIAVAQGANGAVAPADVDAAAGVIEAADVLVVQMEIPAETVYHAIRTAHARGTKVLLNPAPAPNEPIPPEILAVIDFLVPNEIEAAHLAGAADVEAADADVEAADADVEAADADVEAGARTLLQRGVKHVIITLGPNGAAVFDSSGRHDVPAFNVEAVDAVGAGDAFCGILACAVAEGANLLDAVRMANAAAAISVTRPGAQPSMPTRDEIAHLLRTAP